MPLAALPAVRLNYAQLASRRPEDQARIQENQSGEHVVMIHGLAANMAFWYVGAAPAFTRVGTVTLYDMRGHGYSDMPEAGYSPAVMTADLLALLDWLGIEKAHLIAHSFGGMVALNFTLAHPDRVKTLILADVRVRSVEPQLTLKAWPRWSQIARKLQGYNITLNEDDPEAGIQIMTLLARLQLDHPEKGEELHYMFLRTRSRLFGTRQAKRWLKLLEATSARQEFILDPLPSADALGQIHQPVLALFGEHSMSMASGRALAERCPNCTFEILPKSGHFFPLTRPKAFAQRSLRFLARSGVATDMPRRRRVRARNILALSNAAE